MFPEFSGAGGGRFSGETFVHLDFRPEEFPDSSTDPVTQETVTDIRQRLKDGLDEAAQTWNQACGGALNSPQPIVLTNSNSTDAYSVFLNYHPSRQLVEIKDCPGLDIECYAQMQAVHYEDGQVQINVYQFFGDENELHRTFHDPNFWDHIATNWAHEIGHVFGLGHDDCPNSIMDGNGNRLFSDDNDPQVTPETCEELDEAHEPVDPVADLVNDGASCVLDFYCDDVQQSPWPTTRLYCYIASGSNSDIVTVTEPDGTTTTTTRTRKRTGWTCLNFPSSPLPGGPQPPDPPPPDPPPIDFAFLEGPRVLLLDPAEGATVSGTIEIRGWAWGADFPLGDVEIFLDGAPFTLEQFQYGYYWPDACQSGVDPEYCDVNSGFSGLLDTSQLDPGWHTLQIGVVDTRNPDPLSVGQERTFFVEASDPGVDGAQIIAASIPPLLGCGETRQGWITLLNTGNTTWTRAADYALGSGSDGNDPFTQAIRLRLPPGVHVAPGEEYRFEWTLTAPASDGDHLSDWRMVRAGVEFGESLIQNVAVRCHVKTLLPVADAFVTENLPYANWGFMPHLRVRDDDSGASRYTFLRFDLSAINDPIIDARLRLRTGDRPIPAIGAYALEGMSWHESSVTWSNWQDGGTTYRWLGGAYTLAPNTWHSLDVLEGLTGPILDLGIASSIDLMELDFWSRESLYPPVLEITLAED